MSLQHFNPHDMAEDMVRQVATGREEVLQDILTTVQHNLQQKPNQHLLAVAPRGYGKSFLARLVALHLKELHDNQGLKIAVALLPEEQPNVTEPYLLLEEICRVLEGKPADSVIPTWYDENSDSLVWEQSLKKIDGALDSKFGAGQGLLVAIVENFDQLLLTVFRDEEAQSRLRKLLSEHPRLMWLATSTSAALDKSYDARLFHAFRQLDLEPWTEQQCIDYFNRQLQALGQEPLAAEGLARARTLAVFIGGTPRLATLLAEVLSNKDAGKAAVVLDTLVDRLTPYYKHRIESLAARPRKLLDALLRVGEPCSQSTLAQRVGAGQAAVAQPFQELQRERMVIGQRASGGREMLYRVSDRVLAHYYRKRFLNHGQALSPLEAIAEFLEAFFSLDEKRNEAGRLRTLGREHDAAVLERLVAREAESVGSWRARVFDINYRLREYAKIIAPTALDRFGEVFAAFTDCRFTEALRLFEQVEQQQIPDNEWLIALLLKASLLVQLTERRNEGFTFLEAAADFAEKNSSAEWQFAAYSIRGNWLWQLGERNLSIAIIKKTIFLQNDLQGQFMKLEASFVQGWVEANENHYEQAISLLNETALQAKAVGCTFIACRAKKVQCYSLGQLRQHEKAVKAAEEAIRWAAEIGDEREQALGIRHCMWSLGQLGKHIEASTMAQEAISLFTRVGDDEQLSQLNRHLAWSLNELGRHSEALLAAETAASLAEKNQDDFNLEWALLEVFQASYALNRYDYALATCLKLLEAYEMPSDEKKLEAKWWFHEAAHAALITQAWSQLQEAVINHAEQFDDFGWQEYKITGAIKQTAAESIEDAFALCAQLVDGLASVIKGEDNRVGEQLHTNFTNLFNNIFNSLAHQLEQPALLRDIAQRIAEQIPENTQTLRQLLIGSALYLENNRNPQALERLDPDIATAIIRSRE